GDFGVDAVQLVEVDHLGAEPSQRPFAGPAQMLGSTIAPERTIPLGDEPALSRDLPLAGVAPECSAEQQFIGERTVDVGAVEQVDPKVESPMDDAYRLLRVPIVRTVAVRHRATAEPDPAHWEVGRNLRV